jgi:uncharacterized protein (DUF2249 family)
METTTVVLDIRSVPPRERHPKIFRAWEALPVGASLTLVNDHDPKPLFYEFKAERAGQFEWTAVERGPERWSVEIKRVAAAPAGAITGDMLVKDIAAKSPATHAVLARRGLDLCCGGIHPLSMAAQAHGVELQELLEELNAALAQAPAPPRPEWAKKADHELDVREDLRAGREPFAAIIAAVAKVEKGQTLLLRAIFEPKPLYKVLALRGFSPWAEKLGEEDWAVWFRRS